ncbi:MAG: DNA alkylation repair protein [Candidatus Marinimicrobia bacterium]|jgi:3-methyladenine DNA glycosylase AlkD|nr:DNA alkylation repair protein [Candidatus Neomarinimicrobiota bacterium]HJM33633.1 DNA alkylation repair protein [Candidatus Neomarinimicrobiota bacterium]
MGKSIDNLITFLESHKNADNAHHMAVYMKNQFPFFGIKTPRRRAITQQWWQLQSFHSEHDLKTIMNDLWLRDEREFQYVACDTGKKYKRLWTPDSIPFLQQLICIKSWWDTVDVIACHMVGTVVRQYPEMVKTMDCWIDHPNMWIRRSAILHQLHFKKLTNEKRLFSYCIKQMHETEFFIRKAIGWALRQYSYTAPQVVIQFVKKHRDGLSSLSVREALKALHRNGYI